MAGFKSNQYLLNRKITVQGYEIAICVIKSPNSKASDSGESIDDFIYFEPGGPGFSGIDSCMDDVKALHKKAVEQKLSLPHIILYDPLGCGASDKARDVSEYNVMNYINMNALIIEEIKKLLQLRKMNLHINGGSFGGITGTLAPLVRPDWVDSASPTGIHIKQIIGRVPANGAGLKDDTVQFLNEKFANEPAKLSHFIEKLGKLFSGGFENQEDYIRNFVLVMAELYAVDGKQIAESNLGKFIARYPKAAIILMKCRLWFENLLGLDNPKLSQNIQIIDGCSLPVINHFFKYDFDGIKVHEKVIAEEIFNNVLLTLVTFQDDHAVRPKYSLAIQAARPNNTCAIVLNGPHMAEGRPKDLYIQLLLSLVTKGELDVNSLEANADIVHQAVYTKQYMQNLKRIYSDKSTNNVTQNDLAFIHQALGIKPTTDTIPQLEAEPEILQLLHIEDAQAADKEFIISASPRLGRLSI